MSYFKVSEIVQFAVQIEENGEQLYRHAAQLSSNDATNELFTHLANEELQHKQMFMQMLSAIGSYRPIESYPGEYLAYLTSYVNTIIFSDEIKRKVPQLRDALSVINFGIQRELESMLFYHDIKQYVPSSQHEIIDQIIEEERSHFSKLVSLKEHYSSA
jgi:rubrerythrin